jgi:putative ABC transport system permease protein
VISNVNKRFREGIQLGDNNLLSIYGFETLYGNAKTALERPFSVIISAEKSFIYFGCTDRVGRTVDIQNFSGLNDLGLDGGCY